MITTATPDTWQNLEIEAARILEECGFAVRPPRALALTP